MPNDPSQTPETPQDPLLGGPYGAEGDSEGFSGGEDSGTLQSGAKEGALPEKYQRYKDIPWDSIPEEAREDVFEGVRKFHGDMTRSSQDAAELRRQISPLRQKADFLDRLTSDPAFNHWYQNRYFGDGHGGVSSGNQGTPAPVEKLREVMDDGGLAALQTMIRDAVRRETAPLNQRLETVSRSAINDRGERELNALYQEVREKGWPSVQPRTGLMTQVLETGRAASVRDAYLLVAQEELLQSEVAKALKNQRERYQQKADTTIRPQLGVSGSPDSGDYSGAEGILRAVREQKQLFDAHGVDYIEKE